MVIDPSIEIQKLSLFIDRSWPRKIVVHIRLQLLKVQNSVLDFLHFTDVNK